MARHLLKLTPGQRDNAHGWVEKALHIHVAPGLAIFAADEARI